MQSARRRTILLALSLQSLSLLLWVHTSDVGLRDFPIVRHWGASATLSAANATLGFGAVLAISRPGSTRREGLLDAANLTGVAITIPEQPVWTEGDLETFRANEGSSISKGSALAWLAHLNALRWFLNSPHSTALILEDDVDWHLALRTFQIPLAASALRSILPSNTTHSLLQTPLPPFPQSPSAPPTYWGPPTHWELLWLGHCGDAAPPSHITSHPHTTYYDPTVLPHASLAPETTTTLHLLNISEKARLLHTSHWPLCTFAYAVTRASAHRILDTYATEGEGGCQAFDVRMLEACRDHEWMCYTVTPELFHHVQAPSEIARVNGGVEGEGGDAEDEVRPTRNIGCSARRVGVWRDGESGEEEMRGWGTRGECLGEWAEGDMRFGR